MRIYNKKVTCHLKHKCSKLHIALHTQSDNSTRLFSRTMILDVYSSKHVTYQSNLYPKNSYPYKMKTPFSSAQQKIIKYSPSLVQGKQHIDPTEFSIPFSREYNNS
ncbi:hypothetical protein V6Z12_D11G067300 [Gossypium hirsutum]